MFKVLNTAFNLGYKYVLQVFGFLVALDITLIHRPSDIYFGVVFMAWLFVVLVGKYSSARVTRVALALLLLMGGLMLINVKDIAGRVGSWAFMALLSVFLLKVIEHLRRGSVN